MSKLQRILEMWWKTGDRRRATEEALNTGKWWGVWLALGITLIVVNIIVGQLVAPWVWPCGAPIGYHLLLVSLVLAELFMLWVVDGSRRWLLRERQEVAKRESEASAEPTPGGQAAAPELPQLPSGPEAEASIIDLDYNRWTDALKFAVKEYPGKFISFGQILQADASTHEVIVKPPFTDARHLMAAVSMQQLPSPTSARLVVYRKEEGTPPRIRAKITIHFDLSRTPAKAVLVGGPDDDEAVGSVVLKALRDQLEQMNLAKVESAC